MKFAQIIEFKTTRIDQFNAELDAWMARTNGNRTPHRAVLKRDRDAGDHYLFTVEFSSYERGMENSDRPETAAFAGCPGASRPCWPSGCSILSRAM